MNISASYQKVGYESMIVIIFLMTAKGNLPHLCYIFRIHWGKSSIQLTVMLQGPCY